MKTKLDEKPVDDDYRVYYDYVYVADGKLIRSDIQGTVGDLRKNLQNRGISAKIITNCDLIGRNITPTQVNISLSRI